MNEYGNELLIQQAQRMGVTGLYVVTRTDSQVIATHRQGTVTMTYDLLNVPRPIWSYDNPAYKYALIRFRSTDGLHQYWLYVQTDKGEMRFDMIVGEERCEIRFPKSAQKKIANWLVQYVQNLPECRLYIVTGVWKCSW